jgi:hypothetical protein
MSFRITHPQSFVYYTSDFWTGSFILPVQYQVYSSNLKGTSQEEAVLSRVCHNVAFETPFLSLMPLFAQS